MEGQTEQDKVAPMLAALARQLQTESWEKICDPAGMMYECAAALEVAKKYPGKKLNLAVRAYVFKDENDGTRYVVLSLWERVYWWVLRTALVRYAAPSGAHAYVAERKMNFLLDQAQRWLPDIEAQQASDEMWEDEL